MKRPKDFRMKTCHGNFVRVQWTPEGLLVDHGFGPRESDEETVFSIEYGATPGGRLDQQCPAQPYLNEIPSWWAR